MNHVAVLELDIGDEAADPGANLNLLDRFEPAGELIPIRDGTFGRLRDRDRGWSGRGLWRRLVTAAGQGDAPAERSAARRHGRNGDSEAGV